MLFSVIQGGSAGWALAYTTDVSDVRLHKKARGERIAMQPEVWRGVSVRCRSEWGWWGQLSIQTPP